jgi:hypothetical protein
VILGLLCGCWAGLTDNWGGSGGDPWMAEVCAILANVEEAASRLRSLARASSTFTYNELIMSENLKIGDLRGDDYFLG